VNKYEVFYVTFETFIAPFSNCLCCL